VDSLNFFKKFIQWRQKKGAPTKDGTKIAVDTPHASIAVQIHGDDPKGSSVLINVQEGKIIEIKTGSKEAKKNEPQSAEGAVAHET